VSGATIKVNPYAINGICYAKLAVTFFFCLINGLGCPKEQLTVFLFGTEIWGVGYQGKYLEMKM